LLRRRRRSSQLWCRGLVVIRDSRVRAALSDAAVIGRRAVRPASSVVTEMFGVVEHDVQGRE
jgi:hypothetical protein